MTSESVVALTGRSVRCETCSHRDRAAIEDQIAQGGQVRFVARLHGLTESSVRRHFTRHVLPGVREASRDNNRTRAASFVQRLGEILDDVAQVRADALDARNPRTTLAAADSEVRLLGMMLDRLGINDTEVIDTLADGQALAQAVSRLIGQHPEIGGWFIDAATFTGASGRLLANIEDVAEHAVRRAAERAAQAISSPPALNEGMHNE